MCKSHKKRRWDSSTEGPLRGNGGTLHQTCATFTQKKVAEFHLESELKKCKSSQNTIKRTDHQQRKSKEQMEYQLWSNREVLKGPCVTVTEEEWNSSLEKINIKKGVMKWIVHWK